MEKTIPNFEQHRRWILRSMPDDVLEFFERNGTTVGDLALNEQEYVQFNQTVENIVNDSIQKIESGTHKYWQISANEIRIDLGQSGMYNAWQHHKANKRNQNEFSGESAKYDYIQACDEDLKTRIMQMFEEQLDILSNGSTNQFILKAKEDLDEQRKIRMRREQLENTKQTYNINDEYFR